MKLLRYLCLALLAVPVVPASSATAAEKPFADKVGAVTVGDVKPAEAFDLPFLTWGGDVATFLANGGDKLTKKGSLFDQQGLKVNLVNGDDFVGQCKNYLEGKTPFIRGTVSQLGQASEVLSKDPRTVPMVFLQLTWSAGDHMVSRPTCRKVNDLKGKKVALQWGGPHVGMFDDVLRTGGLTWDDVKVVWTDDVVGDKGPAGLFRKDASIDACFVITPDMIDLTGGGLEKEGSGAEKSVKGARVLVSTVYLSHSIADVYACRKDYYDKNKEMLEKLAGAFLKGAEDLVDMRRNHEAKDRNKELDGKYKTILKMTQDILGKDAIPDDDSAHGLIMDATFVALPGNFAFFKDDTNPVNFQNRQKAAVDVAVAQGYATKRYDLIAADINWDHVKDFGKLKLAKNATVPKGSSSVASGATAEKFTEDDTIAFFTINFDEGQTQFPLDKYRKDFEKAIEESRLYGNTFIAIRGHVDPTKTLRQFVTAGEKNGAIRRTREGGVTHYFLVKTGKEIDLADTKKVLELIKTNMDFEDKDPELNPKITLDAAKRLSEDRAASVNKAMMELAKSSSVKLDMNQFKVQGVGIEEPVIGKPKDADEAARNRRVEFRIIRISPEKLTKPDFDF